MTASDLHDDRLSDSRGRPIGGFPYWNYELTDQWTILWKTGWLMRRNMPELDIGYWHGLWMPIDRGEWTLNYWRNIMSIGGPPVRTIVAAVRLACKFGPSMPKYVGIFAAPPP